MDLEKIRIQQLINNIPSVHTFADKSISSSSRSGKAESFEVVKEVPKVEGMYSVKMSKIQESDSLPDIRRFSSWFRLIRATAWLLRILHMRKRISDLHIKKLPSELLPEEIHMAENV
ncbi:hypothetical protein JTB14_035478 [Gonioctena quinquepunctata]|nr:hypothetical protein JTB14_035478 [Gonioctena quinquepunctata]